MASLPHLANDPHDQKHQVFLGVPTHFDGREDGVGGKLNRRVTLPPGHLNGNKLLAVLLVARLPVLLLAIYAAVLGNLALLALLQDGLIRLPPVVNPAVGTYVCQVDRRGNAGRHHNGRPQEGKARGAMRETLAAKVCLPPGFVCLGWPPSFVCHQAVAATSALRLSQLSSTAEQ